MSLGITQLKAGASRNGGSSRRGFRRASQKQTCLSSSHRAGGVRPKSAVRRSIQKLILTRLSGVLEV